MEINKELLSNDDMITLEECYDVEGAWNPYKKTFYKSELSEIKLNKDHEYNLYIYVEEMQLWRKKKDE